MHLEKFFIDNAGASIACFAIFTILVCGLATLMTKFAVAIKDKAHIPDGVVGGILIGAITSIPELITSVGVIIESTKVDNVHASEVFGDVIGSNMFCFLIMAVVLLVTVNMFKHREANQINTVSLVFMIVGTLFCFLAGLFDNNGMIYHDGTVSSPLVWHGFNFFSILILLCYGMAVFSMIYGSRVSSHGIVGKGLKTKVQLPAAQKVKQTKLLEFKMSSLILLLIGTVILLTASSIILGTSCSGIIEREGLSKVFGRTLLLGMATSLPELVAVVTLAYNRRYNMVIDSMVGSCAFNMTILFIANIVLASICSSPETNPMYVLNYESITQLILFSLEAIFLVLYLVINSRAVKQYLSNRQTIVLNTILLSLTVLSYILYLVLGGLEQANIIPY